MEEFARGLVPLSADPVTIGHIWLIKKARERCDHVVVLVANNDYKNGNYLFTLEERIKMVRRAVKEAGIPNVNVIGDSGLLVDVFLREGVDAVFRGIRDRKDRLYEEQLARWHSLLIPGFHEKIVFLEAEPVHRDLSSTLVKALVRHHADVDGLVPLFVKDLLEQRIHGFVKVGITGTIASGKSYLAEQLATVMPGLVVVNFDGLIRELYREQTPGAQRVRDQLMAWLGVDVLTVRRTQVDREVMRARLFTAGSERLRDDIVNLTKPHVMRLYRKHLKTLPPTTQVVLVEWAQMAEMDLSHMVNHNVIVVEPEDHDRFASKRRLSPEVLAEMRRVQWSADRKIQHIANRAREDGHGKAIRFINRWTDTPRTLIRESGVLQKIQDLMLLPQT